MDEEVRAMLVATDPEVGEKAIRLAFEIGVPIAVANAGERPFLEFLMELLKMLLPILLTLFKPV
jgi:hypothetical protein